jgi:hypothetical protein
MPFIVGVGTDQLLDDAFAGGDECDHVSPELAYSFFVQLRHVSVVACLPRFEGPRERPGYGGRHDICFDEMLLEQAHYTAVTSRIEIACGEQGARCVKGGVMEPIQGAAPAVRGNQNVGLVERVVGEPKTVPRANKIVSPPLAFQSARRS